MSTTNIDDVLMGAVNKTTYDTQKKPEAAPIAAKEETFENAEVPEEKQEEPTNESNQYEEDESETVEAKPEAAEVDDYGNEKSKPRSYSEDEVNNRINQAVRERISRFERNTQVPAPQQVQQAAQSGFEYNADSAETWQQQLAQFTERVVEQREQRVRAQSEQARQQEELAEFHGKFQQGMGRFKDFESVVGSKPITDAMTESLKGIDDPTAFIYAASKRAPAELERISKISNPIKQVVEMGKLEEKMRKQKPISQTPKPLTKTSDDMPIPHAKKKSEPTIEEMIAQDAKRRLDKQRRK